MAAAHDRLISEVRHFRELENQTILACHVAALGRGDLFALAGAAAFGAGHVWASGPMRLNFRVCASASRSWTPWLRES